jgi:hypothetical protein
MLIFFLQVPFDDRKGGIFNFVFMCRGLGLLVCSGSELTSETMNPFGHFGSNPWTGDWPTSRSLPTQGSTTQGNADIHRCFERDSNSRSHCSSGPSHKRLRPRGHWDRPRFCIPKITSTQIRDVAMRIAVVQFASSCVQAIALVFKLQLVRSSDISCVQATVLVFKRQLVCSNESSCV